MIIITSRYGFQRNDVGTEPSFKLGHVGRVTMRGVGGVVGGAAHPRRHEESHALSAEERVLDAVEHQQSRGGDTVKRRGGETARRKEPCRY